MKHVIDAIGLSCPEPVLKLKKALNGAEPADEFELLLDNRASVENCTRFAKSKGFDVSAEGERGRYRLNITGGIKHE